MLSHFAKHILLGIVFGIANAQKEETTPIYIDNIEALSNTSNIIGLPFPVVQAALKEPNATHEVSVNGGYDWTKPYSQAVRISGYKAHLRIAYDVPIPEKVVHNSTTALSSLSFSIPKTMIGSNGFPKPMDSSWALCRHIYVSTQVQPTTAAASDSCSFLSTDCTNDIKSHLTKNWLNADPNWPCSELPFYTIAESCQKSFGYARADVIAYDSSMLADPINMKAMAVDEESVVTWRIGTGYQDRGRKIAYERASNRTFLVVDVWGHSSKAERRIPDATLTCLSAKANNSNFDSIAKPSISTTSSAHPKQTPYGVTSSSQGSSGARGPSFANPLGKSWAFVEAGA